MSSNTDPHLPGLELVYENTGTASAHYKGTRLCREIGADVEIRFRSGYLVVHLLTTAQAEQLRLDLERALERNAHAPWK